MSNPEPQIKLPSWLPKVGRGYQILGMGIFNMLLALVLFNLALAIVFRFRGPDPTSVEVDTGFNPAAIYPEASLAAVYPDFPREERNLMLRENWSRKYIYDDYVLFKERPYKGKYVNVTEASFRAGKDQGPWPPEPANLNVFVFGGSTTFGYGLADEQTVPSYLQEALAGRLGRKVCVYNFGTGWYYSTQERIAFERLLCKGNQPDMVVFIDGFNDTAAIQDMLPFRQTIARQFEMNNREHVVGGLIHATPMGRLMRGLERRAQKRATPNPQEQAAAARQPLNRYQTNKLIIDGMCRELGIVPVFVWQPVPGYKYNVKYHLFARSDNWGIQPLAYEEMAKVVRQRDLGSNFLWCADLQENERECLYVDANHYSAKFAKKLAENIAEMIASRGLWQARAKPQ